jgi:hypothetical protein
MGNERELMDLPVTDTVRMKGQSLFIMNFYSHIRRGLISLWLYKENNKLRD